MSKLTDEQAVAAAARGKAVLVSAAAGSGKTTVLTERVAALCLDGPDPVDIDRLLVVTFTEKAALEMRQRIGNRLRDRADAGDERAIAQLRRLPDAQISTIHAFGYALLREEWERAGRDPELELLDERAATLVRLRALDIALDRSYAATQGMAELVAHFGGMGEDDALREALLEASSFLDALPDSTAALRSMLDAASSREHFGQMLSLLQEDSRRTLRQAASLMRQAAHVARTTGDEDLAQGLLGDVQRLLEAALPRTEDWDDHRLRIGAEEVFPTVKGITKCIRASQLREGAKRRVKTLAAWLLAASEDVLWQRQVETLPRLALFFAVLEEFRETYRQEKLRLRALDFSDLEQEAHRLLLQPDGAVAERLRRRYREVLVDEFQDVSPLQDAIVAAVAGEAERSDLFTVGDPKQSIYAFRHAAPWIFLGRQTACTALGTSFPLRENFRCRPEIVAVVNHLFRQLMHDEDSPRYDDAAMLVAGRGSDTLSAHKEQVRLVLIGAGDGEEDVLGPEDAQAGEDDEPQAAAAEVEGSAAQEATWIAREIARLVASGHPVYDREEERIRPIAYRDCAVLLRGLSSVAADYANAFEAAGVPAEVQRSTGYMGSLEVQTMLGLLRAIELPQRDRDLAITLRAPFFGVSARRLREMRDAAAEGSLFSGLEAVALGDPALQAVRLRLLSWRHAALAKPLAEFVPWLLEETRYRAFVAGLPRSARRLRDLDDFEARALRFRGGLGLFLREFEELGRRQIDEAPPPTGVEDAVSVLTIHRSKGLEWPVVFVAGLHRSMKGADGSPTLRWHLRHKIGPAWVEIARGVRRETAAMRAIRAEAQVEGRREEVRLLYVALTRARDRLYLTAVSRKEDPVPGMDEDRFLAARSQLDWIWPCLLNAGGLPVSILRAPSPLGAPRARLVGDFADVLPDATALDYLGQLPIGADGLPPLLPARISATDLAGAAEGSFAAALRRRRSGGAMQPELDADGGRTKGTLTHLFLQHLDYGQSAAALPEQLAALIERGLLPAQARSTVDVAAVERFLQTALAQRLRSAPRLEREVSFSLLVDAAGRPAPHGDILLQGKIDLLLRDAAGWLVLDFKTDHIAPQETMQAAQAYEGQVAVYRAAVRAIAGASEVSAILVFLQPGVLVPV
ncbi:MAG: UvrD-helicase domain-containing protein [Thermaerobacter sp.]|nr:UvrD-helicase domain-containing protein [Thermaerobacter sp.]